MMKHKILLLMVMFCTGLVWAERLATLEEPLRPNGMAVGSKYIYVLEEPRVYVYSREDFKLVGKFGKEGEGPQEFKISTFGLMPMFIFPGQDKLAVNSNSKLSFFTPAGTFIDEVRVPPMLVFLPFGENYICTGSASNKKGEQVLTLNLCNGKFVHHKELCQSDLIVGMAATLNFPLTSFSFQVYEDKAYIVSGKDGFVILVFDKLGNKVAEIKKDYKALKVPEDYKRKTLDYYKNSAKMKQFWPVLKDRLVFKNYYPPIQDIKVYDQRIYVLTNQRKGDKTECIILDLGGVEQKRLYVPLPESYGDIKYLYDIRDRCFFRLVENQEDEAWELHREILW